MAAPTYQFVTATPAGSTTTASPALPGASVLAGNAVYCTVISAATSGAGEPPQIAEPAGWTRVFEGWGGTGSAAVGAGPRKVTHFKRDTVATAGETTTVAIVNPANSSFVYAWQWGINFTSGATLSHGGSAGSDTSSATSFSAVMAADPGITTDDFLVHTVASCVATGGWSAQAFSVPSATIGTVTERVDASTTSGHDARASMATGACTAGTSTGAATLTATNSTAGTGCLAVLRIRESSGSAVSADAAQTVTATQTAAGTSAKPVAAGQTVTATQTAVGTSAKPVGATQTVTATQTAAATAAKPAAASQVVTATQSAAASAEKPIGATQTVTATQAATATVAKSISAAQTLTVTQTAAGNVTTPSGNPSADAAQVVTAAQTATASATKPVAAAQELTVVQTATAEVVAAPVVTYLFTTPVIATRVSVGLARATWLNVGISVLKENGAYRQVREPSQYEVIAADVAYLGGHIYPIGADERDDLVAAGYSEFVTES